MYAKFSEFEYSQLQNLRNWIEKEKVTVAVSLSSGAAEGLGRNIALMEILIEQSIPIHEIHGCSAGSTVAIPYSVFNFSTPEKKAQADCFSLEDIRNNIIKTAHIKNIFSPAKQVTQKIARILKKKNIKQLKNLTGFFSTQKIEKEMKKEIPYTFSQTKKDLYIYAEKEFGLSYEIFCKEKYPDLQIVDAAMASIAMPHIFEPKQIYGKNYIDGALLSHTPLYSIYKQHKSGKNKNQPLVIFVSTIIYNMVIEQDEKQFYKNIKNYYFHKTVDYMLNKEIEELHLTENVYIFLFYPFEKQIYGLSFHKVKSAICNYKKSFYNFLKEYLSFISINSGKINFPVEYFKK